MLHPPNNIKIITKITTSVSNILHLIEFIRIPDKKIICIVRVYGMISHIVRICIWNYSTPKIKSLINLIWKNHRVDWLAYRKYLQKIISDSSFAVLPRIIPGTNTEANAGVISQRFSVVFSDSRCSDLNLFRGSLLPGFARIDGKKGMEKLRGFFTSSISGNFSVYGGKCRSFLIHGHTMNYVLFRSDGQSKNGFSLVRQLFLFHRKSITYSRISHDLE